MTLYSYWRSNAFVRHALAERRLPHFPLAAYMPIVKAKGEALDNLCKIVGMERMNAAGAKLYWKHQRHEPSLLSEYTYEETDEELRYRWCYVHAVKMLHELLKPDIDDRLVEATSVCIAFGINGAPARGMHEYVVDWLRSWIAAYEHAVGADT